MKDLPALVHGLTQAVRLAATPVREPGTGLAARAGVHVQTGRDGVVEQMESAQLRQLQYLEQCARALAQMAQFERERILAQRQDAERGTSSVAQDAQDYRRLHAEAKAAEASAHADTAAHQWAAFFGEAE